MVAGAPRQEELPLTREDQQGSQAPVRRPRPPTPPCEAAPLPQPQNTDLAALAPNADQERGTSNPSPRFLKVTHTRKARPSVEGEGERVSRLPSLAEIHPWFQRKPRYDGGWMVRCPCHHDRTPSLSLSEGDNGKLLWFCHAACGQQEVRQALIEVANRPPSRKTNAGSYPQVSPSTVGRVSRRSYGSSRSDRRRRWPAKG